MHRCAETHTTSRLDTTDDFQLDIDFIPRERLCKANKNGTAEGKEGGNGRTQFSFFWKEKIQDKQRDTPPR